MDDARQVPAPGTRTDAVQAAILHELVERRAHIDRARDIGEITITVKLQAGTTWVRGVVWMEERRRER